MTNASCIFRVGRVIVIEFCQTYGLDGHALHTIHTVLSTNFRSTALDIYFYINKNSTFKGSMVGSELMIPARRLPFNRINNTYNSYETYLILAIRLS